MVRVNKGFRKANKYAAKGHIKRWKKGQSSNFNPTYNAHRLEAKKKAVFRNQGQGSLTQEKLIQHNKIINSNENEVDDDDMSLGGDTALTAFTNCSIPTFNRLIKNWNANSFLHKEMLAVLAAVTDVLKTSGGKETETGYFAALITTLDVVDTDEGLTAVICLLSMVVKRLNPAVLKLHAETSSGVFTNYLIKFMNTEHCALLRNLLSIQYYLLRAKTTWNKRSAEEFSVVLEFTTHAKPKVRKSAQSIVRSLLVDHIPETAVHHPAADDTANFCSQKLENSGLASQTTFYILSLLKSVICAFPKESVQSSCETILRVMTLSNAMVTSSCLNVFHGLFRSKPKLESLPVALNARLIMALYDYQPNINDSKSLIDWLESLDLAFANLYRLDANLCLSHLPKFYDRAVKCWLADRDEVLVVVASILKNLIQICVHPESPEFQQAMLADPINNSMHRIFHSVEEALTYQYHKAWKHVLSVLATFFEVMGKHCYTVMLKCLQSLSEMHESYQFPYLAELEKTIGAAVHHIGPRTVLKAIPLKISDNSDKPDFPRSWFLPLLRDHIKKTELDFFIKHFLPLAAKMRNKVLSLEQDGKIIESKLFDVICSQIWSLLPGFCKEPTDLKKCFKDVARILGIILRDEPKMRMTILSSLRLLINTNAHNEENTLEIAKFSKNYLPILFNLYTTETKEKSEERIRLAVYETCKVYLNITDKELCHTFFNKAMERLAAPNIDPFLQQALIDLTRAMLPLVDESFISTFYDYCKQHVNNNNHTTQKKCYSAISVLCSSESEPCQSFLRSHLEDLRSLLCGSSTGLIPSTKALRLNCLKHIVSQSTETEKECVSAIIPEAVLCTKEGSLKARAAAYDLLVETGTAFKRWYCDDIKGGIREYVALLLAGLAGSPHLMSSTILSLGRIMYEFKDSLDSDLIGLLIENMCLLLTSKSREVVTAAMSFVKILFKTFDTLDLAQHVELMVKSLTNLTEDNQRHFRFTAREIFTKLIRKFGYEMILKMVPEKLQKHLNNIRKTEAKKKRDLKNKTYNDDDDDDEPSVSKRKTNDIEDLLEDSDEEIMVDDDEEEDKPCNGENNKRKKGADPWIEEGDEDNIVDFMDPSINRKILASKPKKQVVVKRKVAEPIPVSKDGRLIIKEEYDAPNSGKNSLLEGKAEALDEFGDAATKGQKRRLDDSDNEEFTPEIKSVNKGFQRNRGKNMQVKNMQPGAQFKAKKAGGDVKIGKIDPYAYIPLNRQVLNKRRQVKLKGKLGNIAKSAKKGAMVGTKNRIKQRTKKRNTKK